MPNISPADKVSLYSITPIKVAATGSTDAKIEAFPLSLPELPFLMQVFSLSCLLISKKDDNATSIVTQSPLKYCFYYNTNMQSCPT